MWIDRLCKHIINVPVTLIILQFRHSILIEVPIYYWFHRVEIKLRIGHLQLVISDSSSRKSKTMVMRFDLP